MGGQMQTLELIDLRGIDVLDVIHSFDPPLRDAIWARLINHPIYTSLGDGAEYVVVTGKWLRVFIGHVAVDEDSLSEFRRNYPPITDRDLVFIRKFK
jgi:hypothetical protein